MTSEQYARAKVPRLTAAAERLQQYVDEAAAEMRSVADRFEIIVDHDIRSSFSGFKEGGFCVHKKDKMEVTEDATCAANGDGEKSRTPTTNHNFSAAAERFLQRTREAASSTPAPSFEQVEVRASARVAEA